MKWLTTRLKLNQHLKLETEGPPSPGCTKLMEYSNTSLVVAKSMELPPFRPPWKTCSNTWVDYFFILFHLMTLIDLHVFFLVVSTQDYETSCERCSLAKAFSVATVFQVVRDNLGPTIISVVGCVRLSRKQAKRRQFRALMACSYTDFFSIISEVYQIDFF